MTGSLRLRIVLVIALTIVRVAFGYPEYEWDDLEEGGDEAGKL